MKNLLAQRKLRNDATNIIARNSTGSYSIADLYERCNEVADSLNDMHIKGLALYADNSIDWMIVDIACHFADICLVPLPTFFSAAQLKHVFECTPIDAIISDRPELFTLLLHADSNQQQRILSQYHIIQITPSQQQNVLPDHTKKITYTSGSTGTPKGVCLSNNQLLLQAEALANSVAIEKTRHLCLLPLSTLLENVAGLYAPLLTGGEVIIPTLSEIGYRGSSSLNEEKFIAVIEKYAPNSIILTPQLLNILVSAADSGWKPTKSLQYIAVGGSRVSPTLLTRAHSHGIPVYEGYGLSECASVVSVNTPKSNSIGSCGQPLSHLKVEMESGEIVVSGNIMLGYVGEPESWGTGKIYTGDLGYLNDSGYLCINGRKKNVLISSYGRNINPEWVESELLSHMSIAECIVMGDARPYCVALLSSRNPTESHASIQRIIDMTNSSLPDYAQIKKWRHLPQPLRAQQNLITENGRPKRQAILSYYHQLIDSMYVPEEKVKTL